MNSLKLGQLSPYHTGIQEELDAVTSVLPGDLDSKNRKRVIEDSFFQRKKPCLDQSNLSLDSISFSYTSTDVKTDNGDGFLDESSDKTSDSGAGLPLPALESVVTDDDFSVSEDLSKHQAASFARWRALAQDLQLYVGAFLSSGNRLHETSRYEYGFSHQLHVSTNFRLTNEMSISAADGRFIHTAVECLEIDTLENFAERIACFPNLQVLKFKDNFSFKPDLFDWSLIPNKEGIDSIYLWGSDIENLDFLEHFPLLSALTLPWSESLIDVKGLKRAKNLKELDLCDCSSLTSLQGIEQCGELTELNISSCAKIGDFALINACCKLEILFLSENSNLGSLEWLVAPALTKLYVNYCENLSQISGSIPRLTHLSVSEGGIRSLAGLVNCPNLTYLDIDNSEKLFSLEGIAHCTKLKILKCSENKTISGFEKIGLCSELESLFLNGSEELQNIEFALTLKELSELQLNRCKKLRSFKGLENSGKLKKLAANKCERVKTVCSLNGCKDLEALSIDECERLELLAGLENHLKLTRLSIRNCYKIASLDPLKSCSHLENLSVGVIGQFTLEPLLSCLNLTYLEIDDSCEEIVGNLGIEALLPHLRISYVDV